MTVDASILAVSADIPAKHSSFYLGMRILPPAQREAMYQVYAFCRYVDDIADGDAPRAARFEELALWRASIEALYAGKPDARTLLLVEPIQKFALQKADFLAVIDGMVMDVERDIRAPDRATFDLYCDRVAVAVGLLSVRIFGLDAGTGGRLSHHLGRALQITNILRDLDEDLVLGRLYLPRESLAAVGIVDEDPACILAHPALDTLCQGLAIEARGHFSTAQAIMDGAPRAAVKAPRIMAAAYGSVLDGMIAAGWNAPRRRISVDRWRLTLAVLRYGIV
ncbi:MAG: presqualene diphosphate synthase HpnD [Beijerinckiaceae bacterium]